MKEKMIKNETFILKLLWIRIKWLVFHIIVQILFNLYNVLSVYVYY